MTVVGCGGDEEEEGELARAGSAPRAGGFARRDDRGFLPAALRACTMGVLGLSDGGGDGTALGGRICCAGGTLIHDSIRLWRRERPFAMHGTHWSKKEVGGKHGQK